MNTSVAFTRYLKTQQSHPQTSILAGYNLWPNENLFLYFSKAFDLVDHSLLIHKLKLYNIDTLWFSSYLNKRFQQTHYAGVISDKKDMISSVPPMICPWANSLPDLCKWSTPLTY